MGKGEKNMLDNLVKTCSKNFSRFLFRFPNLFHSSHAHNYVAVNLILIILFPYKPGCFSARIKDPKISLDS